MYRLYYILLQNTNDYTTDLNIEYRRLYYIWLLIVEEQEKVKG